ncbi:MAG: ABC transporter permease [Desulfatibacillaceae bacterium]
MFGRFKSIFVARTLEFFRDRASLGWNFMFPFLVVAGFALMFSRGGEITQYKAGVVPTAEGRSVAALPADVREQTRLTLVECGGMEQCMEKLRHHKLHLVLEAGTSPLEYYMNPESPDGQVAEALLLSALAGRDLLVSRASRGVVPAGRIEYVDWLFPGIIAMNMMFSALFGVGYVVVRYRKMGVLKRLSVTPLTAFEYLSAEVLCRILLILFASAVVYGITAWMFGFACKGSYVDLFVILTLGAACVTALSLIIACRGTSEEFANGLLNAIAWPMMFLSEVWFSLEGTPDYVQGFAEFFPLTHVIDGMRAIIFEGATLADLGGEMLILVAMTGVFLAVGSALFRWTR